MKRWTIVITILVFLILNTGKVNLQQIFSNDLFHTDSIKHIVYFLANDSLNGRLTGSKEMRLAADLISGEFNKSGLNYHNDIKDYFSNFEFTAFPNSEQFHGINLIGVWFGKSKPEEFIIF